MKELNMPGRSRRACLLALAGLLAALLCGFAGREKQANEPPAKTVRVVIDYNDGVQKHFTRIPWKEGMTAFGAMQQARKSPHGITFESTGRGATAFVVQIDDLKNEGGGEGKKNWLFRVNGTLAERSFGAYELEASDMLEWRFDEYPAEDN